jgi:uncharacterized protein (TIGR00369 family)
MSETPPDVSELTATGAEAHFRRLEALYRSAPVNHQFESAIEIVSPGHARIRFKVEASSFHAANAAHGTLYFKMLDDAAFYAANSLISDRFLLTTAFNLHFTRPMREGEAIAEGRWISGRRRVMIADAHIVGPDGEEAARGTGTFLKSHIPLSSLPGYKS